LLWKALQPSGIDDLRVRSCNFLIASIKILLVSNRLMLLAFEKFESESKIHIEKLVICGYNNIEKFS